MQHWHITVCNTGTLQYATLPHYSMQHWHITVCNTATLQYATLAVCNTGTLQYATLAHCSMHARLHYVFTCLYTTLSVRLQPHTSTCALSSGCAEESRTFQCNSRSNLRLRPNVKCLISLSFFKITEALVYNMYILIVK